MAPRNIDPWARIASGVPPAGNQFPFNSLLAGGTLEAMRTQGVMIQ
jgi:hypothetical protein